MGHETKCATLHGHNGIVEIFATPIKGLDSLGRVVDFSVLKEKIGGWVENNWDHTMILFSEDKDTIRLVDQAPKRKPCYLLDCNPTAENLAKYLLWTVCPRELKDCGVIVYKILFAETENCFAEQTLDPLSKEVQELYQVG